MEIKTQRMPLPVNERALHEVTGLILRLPQLHELKVTTTGVEVRRGVGTEEEVVPETVLEIARGVAPDAPDAAFLLSRIELESLPASHEMHPLHVLMSMMMRLQERRLLPCVWYVAVGDHLDKYLALRRGTLAPMLFAVPVHYVSEDQLPEGKLVLVGSPTRYLVDASYGVLADIGG